MKKTIFILTILISAVSFAQVEKPSEGTIYEVMFTPNLDSGEMFSLNNPLNGHIMRRTFNDANSVTRWKAHFSYASVDGVEDDNMVLGLQYGKEKHHEGSSRLATYTGWQAGFLYADIAGNDSTAFTGGVFVGANYYIANNLYIGTEIDFTLEVGEDTTAIGPGINGMLTLGFKM
ncbi:MAG: hypothetical protein O2810_03320 [Bacteroidetes bacterium]|nr:hypothetical protein [Bacteroidota bacterium]MDA0888782.1 hypothetical protein [Bacteroidota bacterium]MDA1084544.1 hypothetical protein [Bacteroidota bacterium]